MDRQQMIQIQTELEQQLSNGDALDDYHREKAVALTLHIKDALSKGDDRLSGDQFFAHKLQELIDDFEIKHPQLTNIVGRISDLLASSGL